MRLLFLVMLLFLILPAAGICADSSSGAAPQQERVRRAIAAYLDPRGGGTGDVELVRLPQLPPLPPETDGTEYEIVGPERIPPGGKVAVSLIVRQGGVVQRNVPLSLEVRHWTTSVVSTRRIDRGAILSPDDVEVRRVPHTPGMGVTGDPREVIGKRTVRSLPAGEPVLSRDLEKVILVKSGQLVTIVAENPLLRLTVPGKAKGNGGAGEMIVVQNMTSNRDVMARVIDDKTVRVDF